MDEPNAIAAGAGDGGDIDLLAASLRASSTDLTTFLDVLAEKLQRALPDRVGVKRRGRLWGGQKRVESVQCDLGERRYLLARPAGRLEARRSTCVRGVVLKSEELSLETWIDDLAADLGAEARESERAGIALRQLLDG
ncbi:MAG: hypothetical protein ACRDLK_08885 [Gaiellaceae bacterium]